MRPSGYWKLEVLADEASVDGRVGQHIELAFIVKRERLGHLAQLAPAKMEPRSSSGLIARCALWLLRGSFEKRLL